MPEITSETWKETYLEKLKESRRTGKPLSEIYGADPCGGRDCNECEIGGCDHGIESSLNPELRVQMEQNAKMKGMV